MKRYFFSIYSILGLLAASSCLFGIGEKTAGIGMFSGWKDMETRQGLTETSDIRPYPVLALSSAGNLSAGSPADLCLSFDEGNPGRFRDQCGHYEILVSPVLGAADETAARFGEGAARFTTSQLPVLSSREEGPLVIRPARGALFAPGNHIRDFSIEFWLCPANPENGEQILNWSSVLMDTRMDFSSQRIQCVISRNRLQWTFTNFFMDPSGGIPEKANIFSLTGTPVLPKTWSHHLIRFNSDYGILEYLVDGRQEAIVYTTLSGREEGDVYTPVIGSDSAFTLGGRYTGLIDEFRILPQYLEKPVLAKYPAAGGRAESRTLDLGSPQASLVRLEASGGRIMRTGGFRSEYAGNGGFRFSDYSEMRFYIRFANSPYQWNMPWIPVEPGKDFPETFMGRYVQIAVDFFPSGDRETTPYLEEIKLVYRSIERLPPPGQISALAKDGAVELSWRGVADSGLGGYLVYFGTSSGEYFGGQGSFASPVDAGNRTSLRIEGLLNGTLYFFAVASYDRDFGEPGEFSRETAARPQKEFPQGRVNESN